MTFWFLQWETDSETEKLIVSKLLTGFTFVDLKSFQLLNFLNCNCCVICSLNWSYSEEKYWCLVSWGFFFTIRQNVVERDFFVCVCLDFSSTNQRPAISRWQWSCQHAGVNSTWSNNKIIAWFLEQLTLSPERSAQHGCSLRLITFEYWGKNMAASTNYFLKRRI